MLIPAAATRLGAKPWLGTVSLDSGALDVPAIMNHRHPRLYDEAFGDDPALWDAVIADPSLDQGQSALARRLLEHRAAPPASTNGIYAAKSMELGTRAEILGQPLNHGEINAELGKPGAYTDAVEAFMASLDPSVAALLKP